MRTHELPTAAEQGYAQAHAAHPVDSDLLVALHGYGGVIVPHPDSPEAGYSRTQVLAIVNRVVPAERLPASDTALVVRHLQPEDDRSAARVRP
jgi:hypothetical protein